MKKLLTLWMAMILALTVILPAEAIQAAGSTESAQVEGSVELDVSQSLLAITEKRTIQVRVDFGERVDLDGLEWSFGGKALSDWQQWNSDAGEYSGDSYITIVEEPAYVGDSTTIEAEIQFGLPYGTTDLSPRNIRVLYPELIGVYDLAVHDPETDQVASAEMKLNVYDEFRTYEEIKPEIDRVFAEADRDRYLEYKKLGESAEGRDIHFVVLARDQQAVEKYLDETLPTALEDPAEILEKLENGTMGDYQIPIWFNNIHPDEVEGIDAQIELFNKLALEDEVTFQTTDENGAEQTVTLNVDDVLDHVIILFNFTHNPDGRVANTRANANGFDLNRDNAYQTQVETIAVNEEIAKWTPLSFIDIHGYVKGFLIEPATPPHNPNFEYDLLVDNMVGQAHAMGRAGVANSDIESYLIPLFDYENGWDDMTPAYTAIFTMLHGSLGHTVEVPDLSQDSLYAAVHVGLGAIDYVVNNKDQLFKDQLTLFKRGVEGEDNRAVDPWFVNQAGEEIGRIRGEHENFFPEYYVIPVDEQLQKNVLEATNMVEYLLRNGIKVEETTEEVSVNGVTYPAGTYVVPMKQAKRGFANAMLYPGEDISDWEAMYDAIVVNFPALRGFDSIEVREENAFADATEAVESVTKPGTVIQSSVSHYFIGNSNNDAIKVVNQLLADGKTVEQVTSGEYAGDFLVQTSDLLSYVNDYTLAVEPVEETVETRQLEQPKVAVIGSAQSKFVVEELGFQVVELDEANVIVDDAGAINPDTISGKAYVGIGGRSLNAVKEANLLDGFNFATTALSHEGLVHSDVTSHLYTAGYDAKEQLYVTTGSWITAVPEEGEILARVADDAEFFVAGWWPGHEEAQGETLAFTTTYEEQPFTLFANDLTYRAHTGHSFRLLSNSLFAAEASGKSAPEEARFPDVPAGHWANEAVETLWQQGIISGHADGTFKPGQALSRGQGAGLLTTALQLESPSTITEVPFTDLNVDDYYARVAWAVENAGIMNGKSNGRFAANDPLTREQMASILVRAFDLENTGDTVNLSDSDQAAGVHKDDIVILAQHGLTNETVYRPKDTVTRAEFATFLYRVVAGLE
ncbi:S-layer homology domain-containing protein [Alkalihalobacillus oceani]|uniref:M14 family metallopeptidase n=1 Tax=Halalkalibacter oceani TaxID=1653776 RepID=UPI00203A5980|nr:S-layer homology domain-containing protein [Halalkalibacter oceani]MCM3761801.1 S-layer homology domain-containing protein [Halalkalibacter oceani]